MYLFRFFTPARLFAACCFAFFVQAGLSLAAQAPVFEAKTEMPEVAEGMRFEVTFSLKNAAGARFQPPDFKGFRRTGGPVQQNSAGFVNGQAYYEQSWTYELEALKAGAYTIGPASISVKDQVLRTKPVPIRVKPVDRNSSSKINLPPGANDDLFIVAELGSANAWVGQQLNYQIKLYTRITVVNPDILELPDFDGFFAKEKRRFDTRLKSVKIKGKEYNTRILHEIAIFPQEAGDFELGPTKIRIGVEQPGGFGALLGPTPVVLQTQTLKLKVNALPAPAPELFCGAVGHYNWELQADKDSLSTDDALTLTLAISGDGDERRFAAPKLPLPPSLEIFEPKVREEEAYENGEKYVHTKTLDYIILPKQPGAYSIQPEFVYFDPDSNKYVSKKALDVLALRVTQGKQTSSTLPPASTNTPTPQPGGRFWEKTIGNILNGPWFWSLLLALLLLPGLLFFLKKRRKATSAAPTSILSRPAPAAVSRTPLAGVRKMLNGEPRAFYDALFRAVQDYCCARLDLEPARWSKETLREKLMARNVPEERIQTLLSVLRTCEQALFGGQDHHADMTATLQKAEESLARI